VGAELVLTNAVVALGGGRFAPGDVVVSDGLVAAVTPAGTAAVDEAGEVYDVAGGTLAPGFGDAHAHPLIGGLEANYVPVRGARTIAEVQDRIAAYCARVPGDDCVYGEGFELTLAPGGRFLAAWLDEVVADRPVVLRANDIHTVWCNSEALRRAGLTQDLPDPVDGRIDRDDEGRPLGTLREWGAFTPALDLVPRPGHATLASALVRASRALASAGITWVQDAWVEASEVGAYVRAASTPGFAVRMNLALRADPHHWKEQRSEFLRVRGEVEEGLARHALTVRTVKFFVDGIIESGTATLLEPYDDGTGCCGLPNWPADEFVKAIEAFDADGFQVHIHAMGDAAVRLALDAIEGAAAANGPRDRRPVLTHLQLVDPVDLPRLAELGVVACFQPLWAQRDALMSQLTLPRLGDRGERQYPIASVLATGARVAFASDWPITRYEPLAGMAVATTRTGADGLPRGGWTPHERIGLGEALDAYTLGPAHQAFEEDLWGAIRPGMRADLVHLDADFRQLGPDQLRSTAVLRTWLGGVPTHISSTDNEESREEGDSHAC